MTYAWTVIGAGPAGIAAVGKLLDLGIADTDIAWIDPAFAGGDIGAKWRSVSSNTQVGFFLSYLNGAKAFRFSAAPPMPLTEIDPEETCALALVADPLRWITEQLRERVDTFETTATGLVLENRQWRIETELQDVTSANVILAVGAIPKSLDYPQLPEIPLEVALDPEKLAEQPLENATVAVFGSSHSSMIVLPHLLRHPVAKVVNFYRSPLKYAVYLDDWILFDDSGLKGRAAVWARENIDGVLPTAWNGAWSMARTSTKSLPSAISRCTRSALNAGRCPKPDNGVSLITTPTTAFWPPDSSVSGSRFQRARSTATATSNTASA